MDKNMLYPAAPANRMRQSITRDHIKVELKKYQIYVGGVVQKYEHSKVLQDFVSMA